MSRLLRAPALAYAYALVMALALGHFLLDLPIQLSDSFGNMLKLGVPWRELLEGEFHQRAYLRPFLWAELKLVYDLSGGHYFAWFRAVHVLQVVVLVLLYVRLVRPRTWLDLAVLPFGLAVLFGLHTFVGTVREAFPINTFMTVLICGFAAANLAFARHRWWIDVLAAVLFAVAALTVESGLLVGVIFAGAALVGARGVSRPGLAALALLAAGYFYLRFAYLAVGSPGLMERSSGFGFGSLEPSELTARFGSNPLGFYLYNVVTSFVSVLLSEPAAGVFRLTYGLTLRDPEPTMFVRVIASAGATALLAVFAWRRRHAWRAWRLDRDDQLVLLFLMVLAANALLSYAYTKDVIMSPAGAFFAVAVFAAARRVAASLPPQIPTARAVALVAFCALVGVTWAIRVVALHATLRNGAFVERNEWARAEESAREKGIPLDTDRARGLLRELQYDALVAHPGPPPLNVRFPRLLGVE